LFHCSMTGEDPEYDF
jgi:hypothetical protein